MSICLNPSCTHPQNLSSAHFCQYCGAALLLKQRYRAIALVGQGGFGRTFLAIDTLAIDPLVAESVSGSAASESAASGSVIHSTSAAAASKNAIDKSAGVRAVAGSPLTENSAGSLARNSAEDFTGNLTKDSSGLTAPSGHRSIATSVSAKLQNQPGRCIIKQILPQALGVDRRQLVFEQEVAQLTQLGQHPQIPALIDHFSDAAASYLVQEYIAGQNLDAVLTAQGIWNESQIRQLLANLLPVLRFLHQHQVIHRDIKPANIIRSDSNERYVLVDFGASKCLTELAQLQTGTTIGSAGYAAPEQTMGKATFASDLYSLGVTCIHLLTGMHPFELYSISEDAWVWRQYLTQPLTAELRRVLDTLLQRATSQRYDSATAVLQALRLETAPTSITSSPAITSSADRLEASLPSWNCIQTLAGHQGEVTAIAISPDGRWIASGSTDKTVRLWSLATGELWQTWSGRSFWSQQGHHDRITALQFSPSSKILISSSTDGTIRQWDLDSYQQFSCLPSQGWGIAAIALYPNQPFLVSGSQDGLLQLWDLETEELVATIARLDQSITALAIEAGGTLWSGYGRTIGQWNLQTDRLLTSMTGHAGAVDAIALSRDGSTLISSGADKLIKLWNLNTAQQQKVIAAHRDRIQALAMHPSEAYFASASADSTVKLWNVWTGERLYTLKHTWGVNAIAFSPNGNFLVSGSADEMIRIWQRNSA